MGVGEWGSTWPLIRLNGAACGVEGGGTLQALACQLSLDTQLQCSDPCPSEDNDMPLSLSIHPPPHLIVHIKLFRTAPGCFFK
jgi:hypothetical protein